MTAMNSTLNQLQADFQVLYQKLRSYHWTVKGPMFFALHQKFEELYLDAAIKVDDLAERALALGGRPLVTLAAQLEASRLAEDPSPGGAQDMVRALTADLAKLTGWLRQASAAAAKAGDQGTVNLLDGMADAQEKEAWMLRSFLSD